MGKKKSYCTEEQKYKLLRILDAFGEFLDKYEYEYFYAERYGAFISNQFDPESNTFLDDYIFQDADKFYAFLEDNFMFRKVCEAALVESNGDEKLMAKVWDNPYDAIHLISIEEKVRIEKELQLIKNQLLDILCPKGDI